MLYNRSARCNFFNFHALTLLPILPIWTISIIWQYCPFLHLFTLLKCWNFEMNTFYNVGTLKAISRKHSVLSKWYLQTGNIVLMWGLRDVSASNNSRKSISVYIQSEEQSDENNITNIRKLENENKCQWNIKGIQENQSLSTSNKPMNIK